MYLPRQKRPCLPFYLWPFLGYLSVVAVFYTPAFALNPDRLLSQYGHGAWRVQDGYFKGTPSAIAQTSDGYVWIGTANGLMRFDGVRFTPWTPPPGTELPSTSIVALLGTHDGSLWIGTSRGLARWAKGTLTLYPDAAYWISIILEDHLGRIWIARTRVPDEKGILCQVTEERTRCYGKSDGIQGEGAGALTEDLQGNLWIGTGLGFERWRPGSFDVYHAKEVKRGSGLPGVEALAATADGTIWVGYRRAGPRLGLQGLSHGVLQPFSSSELDGTSIGIASLKVTGENGLMISTEGKGLYRIANGKVEHFDASDGLTGDEVYDSMEDREGNLWVLTSEGIDCFSDRPVASFSVRQGVSSGAISSVFASRNGDVWIATYGGVDLLSQGKISTIDKDKGCPASQATTLYEESPGVLWMGMGDGLWIHEHGECRPINRPNGSPLGAVWAMTQDVDGSMWIDLLAHSNDLGGVVHIQNRQIVEEVTGLPDYVVPVVLPDPRGGLWFGLGHGQLAHYRDGKLDIISSFGPPSNSRLLDLTMDPKGRLLGATADGLVGLKDGLTKKLTVQNGLPCNRLYSMIFDDRGSLWLNATCGLLELTSDELQAWWENSDAKVRPRVFDVLDGAQPVLSPFGHTTAKSPDGTLWFANMFALQTVNPTQPNRNIKPPPVHIEELIANRKSYGALNNLRLPPLLRDLEIDYTALSFVSPKKVTFRYRLEGHDTDWQDPGARRQAFYSDLKPGKYTFRVIACNNSGLWNDVGDSLGFYVAPTFYQTLWFRILACGIAAAMLWAFYLFRLEQATAQIQERLGARMEERERIARELHDTLLQGFQGLMLRLQAVMKTLPAEEPAHQMLEKVLDRADEVLLEGRQSVRDLREEGTAGDELSKTLAQCGEELAQGQVCEFSLLVVGVPQTIGPIVFDEAHRIAREALINAFQHSRAQKIEVDLTYTDVGVSLHIRDDGAGIDPQILRTGKAGHWGLSGMRERAQKIGGQLKIWSNPVAGTEVELTIPAKVAYPQEVKQSLWLRIKQAVTRKKYVSAE